MDSHFFKVLDFPLEDGWNPFSFFFLLVFLFFFLGFQPVFSENEGSHLAKVLREPGSYRPCQERVSRASCRGKTCKGAGGSRWKLGTDSRLPLHTFALFARETLF
ncbi:unnamed protein product [Linum tenue]|uniref:Uncharacterized protein n=1 Tax=Linum tenue TaxID=586396 RepID=A0AAV0RZY0_9ROSI|nr:unnamed protein product [Linum tenue]